MPTDRFAAVELSIDWQAPVTQTVQIHFLHHRSGTGLHRGSSQFLPPPGGFLAFVLPFRFKIFHDLIDIVLAAFS